jgi:hypothetical protein
MRQPRWKGRLTSAEYLGQRGVRSWSRRFLSMLRSTSSSSTRAARCIGSKRSGWLAVLAALTDYLGTEIRLLAVRAPKGARALVRCLGRGCPLKRATKVVGRDPVRFAGFKSLMPAGVVLEVLVQRGDSIGKFTRFKLRQNRRPQRADGCLWPGTTRMAPCPVA